MSNTLLSRLMRGEQCSAEPVDLDEVCEMLASGNEGALDKASAALWDLNRRGIVSFVETGKMRASINTFTAYTFHRRQPGEAQTRPRVESLEQQVRRESRERSGQGDGPPPVLVRSQRAIAPAELVKGRGILLAAGLWPKWADQWCGVFKQAEVQAMSCMPFTAFKARYGRCYTGKGTLDSIHKNRSDKGRKQPYGHAFNDDGSVNVPKFVDAAKSLGAWTEGDGGAALQDALTGGGVPARVFRLR